MLSLGKKSTKKKVYDLQKIKKQVKRKLSDHRFEHTLGVTYMAAALAMRYGADLNQAMTAGLLHDCAKYMTTEELFKNCERYKIEVTNTEKLNPALLHAKVGAVLADKKYKVHDKEIISAILHHTTGTPDMPLLDKIIFIADYMEPHREPLPNLDEIRKQAFVDIDRTMVMICKSTLEYLKSIQNEIDESTQKTYDYYVSKVTSESKEEE